MYQYHPRVMAHKRMLQVMVAKYVEKVDTIRIVKVQTDQ